MTVSYKTLVPDDSFIGQYMQSMDGIETAHEYDFWCAAWILATVLGREVIVDRPRVPVHFSLYAILVAESGITRKSTAVNRAAKFLGRVSDETILRVGASITPEKLLFDMAFNCIDHGKAHTAIAIDEMVTLFGKQRYSMQLPALLTDLYDCPEFRKGGGVLSRRESDLKNVFITLLTASTPNWLLTAINPDVVEGGFTSRTLFVMASKPKRRIPWPDEDTTQSEIAQEAAKSSLGQIVTRAKQIGTIGANKMAITRFSNWYKKRKEARDEYLSSFESREDEHVLRLAGLLAINDRSYVINGHHMNKAIAVITEIKQSAARLLSDQISPDKLYTGIDNVRKILVEQGTAGIKHTDLFARVRRHFKSDELQLLMELMHEQRMIDKFELRRTETSKRPYTVWRATSHILNAASLEVVKKGMLT